MFDFAGSASGRMSLSTWQMVLAGIGCNVDCSDMSCLVTPPPTTKQLTPSLVSPTLIRCLFSSYGWQCHHSSLIWVFHTCYKVLFSFFKFCLMVYACPTGFRLVHYNYGFVYAFRLTKTFYLACSFFLLSGP